MEVAGRQVMLSVERQFEVDTAAIDIAVDDRNLASVLHLMEDDDLARCVQ